MNLVGETRWNCNVVNITAGWNLVFAAKLSGELAFGEIPPLPPYFWLKSLDAGS